MPNPLRRALDWNTQYQEDQQNNSAFTHYALLAGPVEAIIGDMAKKYLSKSWVIITTPLGTVHVEFNGKDSPRGHEFVVRLEAEASRQETAAQG